MTEKRRKVGLMGGTFDPIHIGHLILAEAAWQQFGLDEIWFLPAGNPPHKRDRAGRATDEQRVDMVRLAIQSNPHFHLSMIDMNPDGYSYTYRTLERLRGQHPDTDFTFIMGADSLVDFDTWREPQKIVDQCQVVVATRDQMDPAVFETLLETRREQFSHDFQKLDTPNLDISSKHLRDVLQHGGSVRYYIPDNVLYYIRMRGVYLTHAEAEQESVTDE